jgi:hypothetical protein
MTLSRSFFCSTFTAVCWQFKTGPSKWLGNSVPRTNQSRLRTKSEQTHCHRSAYEALFGLAILACVWRRPGHRSTEVPRSGKLYQPCCHAYANNIRPLESNVGRRWRNTIFARHVTLSKVNKTISAVSPLRVAEHEIRCKPIHLPPNGCGQRSPRTPATLSLMY